MSEPSGSTAGPDHAPEEGHTSPVPAHGAPAWPRPQTEDPGVERVLDAVDRELGDPGNDHVAALTEAHRLLQARLTEPASPPPVPGQARPGPR